MAYVSTRYSGPAIGEYRVIAMYKKLARPLSAL